MARGALVASIVAFVTTRPTHARAHEMSPFAIGRCGGDDHFVRVDVVPSYHHEVYK